MLRISLTILSLGLAACEAISITAGNAPQHVEAFMDGRATLNRTDMESFFYCPIPDGRRHLRDLWINKNWTELSRRVMRSDCDMDIMWFYLAESANGLGLRNAAMIYYKRALSAHQLGMNRSCAVRDSLGDQDIDLTYCAGFSFPRDIKNRVINAQRR